MKTFFLSATAALICLAMSPLSARAQGSAMKEAKVTQVIKDVKLLPSQAEPRPATVSDQVKGDTAIRTGVESRAELTFSDLTIARLGANTIFSFNEGTRTVQLGSGAILLRVPKGSGGAKVQTAAVTAAITGTTVIVEYNPKSYAKYLVLEGTMRVYLKGVLGESVLMHAGQMMIVNPNARRLSEVVDYDLERLWNTSLLVQGFSRPLGSEPLVADAQHVQLERKAAGELLDTNLVIFGRGTLVSLTDPQSLDVVDRKTAAVTLPTPTPIPLPIPTPTPTPIPVPTPTPTPIPVPTPTPTPIPLPTPTPTPIPVPTPTPTPVPTPVPSPSKFGTPPPITSSVPYPIDNGTVIQTDPAITRAGVTDFGRIYRDPAQDGSFSTWAFTATSPFDTTAGIDALYGPNVPVAAFKFVALQLVGNPTIDTSNGGATHLALISVGPITSAPAGDAHFTFTGMQSVLIATQNGSIDISGPDITFQNIPLLIFYARGTGSNLTLGGMGIFGVSTLRLIAENNIQISAPEILTNGANGGILRGTAGGSLTVNSTIDTNTAFVPVGSFSGTGGTVSLSALGGTLSVGSRIQTSYNDPPPAFAGTAVQRSATGGIINLDSGLTSGTGITLSSTASLLSLLNPAAPGPGGSITLTTPGSDIITNGATIQADRGTITIQQSSPASSGTAQITLNGGTISSETLTASSKGNLSVGSTTPVNLSAVSLALLADGNVTWSGGTLIATAIASPGYVTLQGGNVSITGAADIERTNGGITDGLQLTLSAAGNLQTNGLTLVTDGSGLMHGGDVILFAGAAMSLGGITTVQTGPTTADQNDGSSFGLSSGGPITVGGLSATVEIGGGHILTNGGNLSVFGTSSYTATLPEGGLSLQVNNLTKGVINTGGNIGLSLSGNLTTGTNGLLALQIDNSNGGRIPTGASITSSIGGNLNAKQVNVSINNRNASIGAGGNITFTVSGALTTTTDANFTILNGLAGTPGGTIASAAALKLTFGDTTIGNDLNAFIDNTDGKIGTTGDEGTVTMKINGKLTVTGRINVFGALTATGALMTDELSGTNVTAPTIQVGASGITPFTFPDEFRVDLLHTITTDSLTSTGGINFNGSDFDTATMTDPSNGGRLTINVPSLIFGSSAADNIQGPVTFNGGSSPNTTAAAGNGGTFMVNAASDITVGSPIEATTSLRPFGAALGGTGGTVNLNSTGGAVTINSPITVSSNEVPTSGAPPRRRSAAGGNINLKSDAATGIAINVSDTGQLLSLLDAAAPGEHGKITILATGASSRININGKAPVGGPPQDFIRADRGSIDIRHTGLNGQISLTNANLLADIVKVGALGDNGVLTIGGGIINANSVLKLYAIGPNGSVVFVSNVLLSGNSMKIIAGNSVTVNNGVVVSVGPGGAAAKPAEVYVLDPTKANYSNFNGGNNSTSGIFIIEGTGGSPVSGANTNLGMAPPAFGDPGGP
jgi:hypothetical protein